MKKTIFKKISVALVSTAIIAASTVGPAFAQSNQPDPNMKAMYHVDLSPLNDSGVSGYATIDQNGDQYTVTMHATGLEPNQQHVQHIHGMTDGSNSSCPTAAQNVDGDKTISLAEGATTYGPILQPLTPFQTTGADGTENYSQTFTVNSSDPTMDVLPLANREIVLHGKTVAANDDLSNPQAGYDATLPVACGHIVQLSSNDQGQSSYGGSSVNVSGNGAGSHNNADVKSCNTSNVSQSNDTRVSNNVSSTVNTGDNRSRFNTGGFSYSNSGNVMSKTAISNDGGINWYHR